MISFRTLCCGSYSSSQATWPGLSCWLFCLVLLAVFTLSFRGYGTGGVERGHCQPTALSKAMSGRGRRRSRRRPSPIITPTERLPLRLQRQRASPTHENLHRSRLHRQRRHGVARVSARLCVEPRPGARAVRVAVPAPSGGRAAGLGDGVEDRRPPRRRAGRRRQRQAAARRAAAHDLALRGGARQAARILRRQPADLHRAALPSGRPELRVLSARQDARRSALDRRYRADERGGRRARRLRWPADGNSRARRTGGRFRRPSEHVAQHHRNRPSRRRGNRRGQVARCRRRHLQPRQQRRHQALEGRSGVGQDLRRMARSAGRDEGEAEGVGGRRLLLQPRLAAPFGQHGAHRRGEVRPFARQGGARHPGRARARGQADRRQPRPDRRAGSGSTTTGCCSGASACR